MSAAPGPAGAALSRRGAAAAPCPSRPRPFAAAGDEPASRGVCPEALPGSRRGQRNPPPLPAGTAPPPPAARCPAPTGSAGQAAAVAVPAAELPSLPGTERLYLPT